MLPTTAPMLVGSKSLASLDSAIWKQIRNTTREDVAAWPLSAIGGIVKSNLFSSKRTGWTRIIYLDWQLLLGSSCVLGKVHVCLPYVGPKAGKAEWPPEAAATGMGIDPHKAPARRATMNQRPRFQAKGQADNAEPSFPQQELETSSVSSSFNARRTWNLCSSQKKRSFFIIAIE